MVDKNKTTGYVVFALGIVFLVVTFSLAIHTYLNPEFIQGYSDLVEIGEGPLAPLVDFLIYIIPVLFLFVMGSVGGKTVKYGIKMIRSPEKKTRSNVESRKKPRTSPQTQSTTSQQAKTEEGKSTAPPEPNKQEPQPPSGQ